MDHFIKDMESIIKRQGFEGVASDEDFEEGSSSDMDFGMFCIIFIYSKFE